MSGTVLDSACTDATLLDSFDHGKTLVESWQMQERTKDEKFVAEARSRIWNPESLSLPQYAGQDEFNYLAEARERLGIAPLKLIKRQQMIVERLSSSLKQSRPRAQSKPASKSRRSKDHDAKQNSHLPRRSARRDSSTHIKDVPRYELRSASRVNLSSVQGSKVSKTKQIEPGLRASRPRDRRNTGATFGSDSYGARPPNAA